VGEIAYTTQLVKPDVACILNIGTAHLGEFGGRDNIAKTKAEIYQGLTEQGVAIVPFGDDYFDVLAEQAQQFTKNILTFGEQSTTFAQAGVDPVDYEGMEMGADDRVLLMGDVFADDIEVGTESQFSLNVNLAVDEIDSVDITLPFAGEHNISNALAAAACALALGVSIQDIANGLENAKPAKGRLNFISMGEHTLIDDTYNANPPAVLAGVTVLNGQPSRHMVVLGDIGELGDQAVNEHAKLGHDIAAIGVDKLFAVGELMHHTVASATQQGIDATHFADKNRLADAIADTLNQSDGPWTILFKGSRFMGMETVLQALLAKSATH
jgi:UDP-N-acetylmuramoyl-tripeptide--D-alanyl-D-alanine ligase